MPMATMAMPRGTGILPVWAVIVAQPSPRRTRGRLCSCGRPLARAGWRRATLCDSRFPTSPSIFSLMPIYGRVYEPGQLQFITASTYQPPATLSEPAPPFDVCRSLARTSAGDGISADWLGAHARALSSAHQAPACRDHQPLDAGTQKARRSKDHRCPCRKSLPCGVPTDAHATALASTVHCDSRYRVWQRRFVPFNVYTEKKRIEKLDYMPQQSGQEKAVSSPDQWPWSSFRFYYLNDSSVLTMDRLT